MTHPVAISELRKGEIAPDQSGVQNGIRKCWWQETIQPLGF